MKKIFVLILVAIASAISSSATILFPNFVDIAPDYSEGNIPSLTNAGVTQVLLSSTTPSFYPKTFEQAVSFLKDVLPGDVLCEETKVGDMRLVTYTARHSNNSDTIVTDGLLSIIYLLEQPDGTYHSGYYEAPITVPD